MPDQFLEDDAVSVFTLVTGLQICKKSHCGKQGGKVARVAQVARVMATELHKSGEGGPGSSLIPSDMEDWGILRTSITILLSPF